jgi:hypothetical protein
LQSAIGFVPVFAPRAVRRRPVICALDSDVERHPQQQLKVGHRYAESVHLQGADPVDEGTVSFLVQPGRAVCRVRRDIAI